MAGTREFYSMYVVSAHACSSVNDRPRLRRLLQAFLAGIALGSLAVGLRTPGVYTKDCQQPYLTALAWRVGVDLFTPITQLSAQ